MAIRQVTSRSIKDGEIAQADLRIDSAKTTFGGVGFYQGENGSTGDKLLVRVTSFV